MAAIYLRHPIHGEKVACTDMEARHDRENGWTDFDPTQREKKAPTPPAGLPAGLVVPSDLPADFPGREALIEAGLTTWAVVQHKTRDELLAVKGIGEKTADAIVKALDV